MPFFTGKSWLNQRTGKTDLIRWFNVKLQNKQQKKAKSSNRKIYLLEFLTKLVQKPASCVRYRGKMWRRQSTTEILERKENFKRSDIKNKIYRKPASASQLSKIVFKI